MNSYVVSTLFFILFRVIQGQAFKIESPVSHGCHEEITADALRSVRSEFVTAKPLQTTRNEKAFIDDLEFAIPADLKELGAAALLSGVRDNDLKGRSSNDFRDLAVVHGNPNFQAEHCLRNHEHDEPEGTSQAINACKKFILKQVAAGLEGLTSTGEVNINARIDLMMHLSLRRGIEIPLPLFYVHTGQALHALQDSFAHAYRTSDGLKITAALNWVDYVNGRLKESRDGPEHLDDLDQCDENDPLIALRKTLSTQASTQLLRAVFDPSKSMEAKMLEVENVLTTYMSVESGCKVNNDFCNAPERMFTNSGLLGCATRTPALLCLGMFILWILSRGRLRKESNVTALTVLLMILASLTQAMAETSSIEEAPVKIVSAESERKALEDSTWGFALRGTGSWDEAAFTLAAGLRYKLNHWWMFGLDGEWNAWIDFDSNNVREGVANIYGTVILMYPLAYKNLSVRTTAQLGSSTLLIDLYGAPRGTTGFYAGIVPLGVSWRVTPKTYVILDPLGFHMAIPQLQGVPLTHREYRAGLGLECMF